MYFTFGPSGTTQTPRSFIVSATPSGNAANAGDSVLHGFRRGAKVAGNLTSRHVHTEVQRDDDGPARGLLSLSRVRLPLREGTIDDVLHRHVIVCPYWNLALAAAHLLNLVPGHELVVTVDLITEVVVILLELLSVALHAAFLWTSTNSGDGVVNKTRLPQAHASGGIDFAV